MHNVQANAPLLENGDKNEESDSSSTHDAQNVDSHEQRAEIQPQEPGIVLYIA